MEMEIKVGDRFIPLEGSPRYGPKYWRLDPAAKGRVWIEVEMSKEERDFERLESTLLSCDSILSSVRTQAITEADAEDYPEMKNYIDGFAIFPSVPFFPGDHPEQRKLEDDWEKRSLAMHAQQQALPLPPEKLQEISPKYHTELKRGD